MQPKSVHLATASSSAPIVQEAAESVSPLAGISPKKLTRYFKYLDDLRESGITNMFGSASYLSTAFDLERKKASAVVGAWMETFGITPAADRATKAIEAARNAK